MRDYIPKNWKDYIVWLIVIAAIAVLFAFGLWPKDGPVPLPPVPVFTPHDAPDGWVPAPEEVQAVAATLEFKVFGDTPAGKSDDLLPDSIYLWQSYSKVFARGPPSRNQLDIGSCVGNGTATAVDRTLATQVAMAGGNGDEYRMASAEVIYGGSRVQIGKGKLGRSDGSVGAWAAQFVTRFGYVGQEKYGTYDLTTYSVATCRTFGNSGVPAPLLTVCAEHKIKDITQVTLWTSAKKALASGYGIAICSGVGFNGVRDANGVKAASGSWGHCMCLDGYHIEAGKEYGHIENSWGPQPKEGPVGWGSPPDSGFWVESATIQKMLSQNDSWAFSAVKGWPSRQIDWFALAPLPRRPGLDFSRFAQRKEVGYAMFF